MAEKTKGVDADPAAGDGAKVEDVIELQVAKGRSVWYSTGASQIPNAKGGGLMQSPKAHVTWPKTIKCRPETAAFLIRSGHCIDPAAPEVEMRPMAGTSSTFVQGRA